ncbi:unnamed protein product [Effrenium voratum]|uniref:Uncharacterized protein n=1 Tax=Effrenium voratum TaxID=2562239 RepID=A0AA36N4T6_9DINO|nr:unnamed protein product [Effrenium voratum]CAJ1457725.1 unnamed protein product [Effrenium voratum]
MARYAIPAEAKKKLFFTSTQESHDGRPPVPVGNFHSLRETQHVFGRAASAPTGEGGEKWRGTSYDKAFSREPVFVDLEVNRCMAAMAKVRKAHVKSPHVGASSYAESFDWKGYDKPLYYKVPDCGAREAVCSGVQGRLESTSGSAYAGVRPTSVPQKFIPVDQLGGVAQSYDFLQSSYGGSFTAGPRLQKSQRSVRKSCSAGDLMASLRNSTYRASFSRKGF